VRGVEKVKSELKRNQQALFEAEGGRARKRRDISKRRRIEGKNRRKAIDNS